MKAATVLAFAGGALAASNMPSIVMKGSKLFYENGTQFYMKGVAYQQNTAAAGQTSSKTSKFVDPLSNPANCKRDVPLLKQLGTNIIRTYAIDPTADHSECMQLLQDAGIYLVSDLGEPAQSINQDTPQWDVDLFKRYMAVVDELAKYPNTMGFFAGNEVANNKTNTGASAYVKAAVRDTKAYIKQKNYRWMGVGYASNDDADIRDNIAHYFNCGDQSEAIDFWGYNIYEWCGQNTMPGSGYDKQVQFFHDYSVPVFFAEYGCNTQGGAAKRIWQETTALYSDAMTPVFSGGIVYMFFEEDNDFGLVKVSGNSVSKLPDFATLQTAVTKADPKGVDKDKYSPTNKAADCPAVDSSWKASNMLPPTPDESLCQCMVTAATCGVADGVDGKDYGKIFGIACGTGNKDICAGISHDSSTGVYGAYSMCSPKDQLTFVLDSYYQAQGSKVTACDFGGQAVVMSGSQQSSCKKALASASAHNAQAATATSGSSATASSTGSFGVHSATVAHVLSLGDFAIGLYMVIAMGVGAGMVML